MKLERCGMKWTKELPTEKGIYWIKRDTKEDEEIIEMDKDEWCYISTRRQFIGPRRLLSKKYPYAKFQGPLKPDENEI